MRKVTRTMSCLLLVSLVLVGLGETDSLVLCIGHDGHISLENTRTGVCRHTLEQVAERMGLPVDHEDVRKNAKCCPCTDMELPGRSLDYPEVLRPIVVHIPESADIPVPLFEPAPAEIVYIPRSEIIPRPPPPDTGDSAARIALRSVVLLI